jgi:hypothetical protein
MSENSNVNSIDDAEEYETIIYNGVEYYLDDSDNMVYEMDTDGTFIPLGRLLSRNPVKIDFKAIRELDLGNSNSNVSNLGDSESNFSDSEGEEEKPKAKPPTKAPIVRQPIQRKELPKNNGDENVAVTVSKPQTVTKEAVVALESVESEENTIDMNEVEYLGKKYVVDMTSRDVYEKIDNDYVIVGKLTSENPLNIKFSKIPDWKEEYADIEPHIYKGVEYMVNPITSNVFLMDKESGEYVYVGEVVTLKPLNIKFIADIDTVEEAVEAAEAAEDDQIELEIIENGGIKYVKDGDDNVYDGKKFELIGKWDSVDRDINFIPSRGFLNINNSCYINSVLFALFYRSSKFIETHILRKNIDSMTKMLRIKDTHVIEAVKTNQTELLKIYKWLHNAEQGSNDSKICVSFRKIYKQVELDKKPVAFHNEKFETDIGDSGEFLFTLFNGFNIKTLVKFQKSFGKIDGLEKEIFSNREETAPIIMVSPDTKPENYFKTSMANTVSGGVVIDVPDKDAELIRGLELQINIDKIKILLMFFQKKTRVPKLEKERMRQRIEQVNISKILEADHKDIDDIYIELKMKLTAKELKEIESIYGSHKELQVLLGELEKIQGKHMFFFTEKIDTCEYRENDHIDYLVLGIDRTKHIGRSLSKDIRPFDIREKIVTPSKQELELEFVIKYIDSPKHYVCYFKNIDDDLWYLFDDLSKKIRIVSSGSFRKMKEETQNTCTLLFYGTLL